MANSTAHIIRLFAEFELPSLKRTATDDELRNLLRSLDQKQKQTKKTARYGMQIKKENKTDEK